MKKNIITLIDGTFSKKESNLLEKIVVMSKTEAMTSFQAFLKNYYAQSEKEEKNSALLSLRDQEGLFIYLSPNTELLYPVEIVHHIQNKTTSHVHLFAGKLSHIQISQKIECEKKEAFHQVFDVSLDSGAKVEIDQAANQSALFSSYVRANVKQDAHFSHISGSDRSQESTHDLKVSLAGPNSEADLRGWWKLQDKKRCSTKVLVEHQSPHTRSRQLYKGVLFDQCRSQFEGKIYVHPEAQKTDAFQLNNNLLMSDGAYAGTKPGLEIFADDVKASHGATVGKIDQEQLFYFKSRGFSEKAATEFLIDGFLKEVIESAS